MHPHYIYVFDSSTANEAAIAVREGQFDSIIQYHSSKHQQPTNKPPHMQPQHVPSHMMSGPPPYGPPPPHHVSPPNHMQPQSQHPIGGVPPMMPPQQQPPPMQQQQPYDPSLSPQKMKERESKLNRLGQLAQLTTQPPPPSMASAPPTMHQMTNPNMVQRPQPPHPLPPPQTQNKQQPSPPQQQPPPQQQHNQQIKQEQHLDPLSSMAAMSECPNMDSYGHTIHHHPNS